MTSAIERPVLGDIGLPIAMAYVPYQLWEMPYEAEIGLSRGTIFPGLDLPFLGGGTPRG